MPCVFSDYPKHKKGYNYLNPITQRTYVAAHKVFSKFEFPYLSTYLSQLLLSLAYDKSQLSKPSIRFIQLPQSHDQVKITYNVLNNRLPIIPPTSNSINPNIITKFKIFLIICLNTLQDHLLISQPILVLKCLEIQVILKTFLLLVRMIVLIYITLVSLLK